jgi:hypothetical protein
MGMGRVDRATSPGSPSVCGPSSRAEPPYWVRLMTWNPKGVSTMSLI